MTMRYLITLTIGLCLLNSCTYRPKEKRLTRFKNNDGQILTSFYKMNGDTVDFKRLVSRDARLIYLGDYALTHQRFTTIDELGNDSRTIDSLTNGFTQSGLLKKLVDDRDVMFIQVIPDSTMGTLDELGFLNLRQDIEGLIDTRLKMDNSGEWFAGDMGAGGNMLFFIDNWDKATVTVLDVLREQNVLTPYKLDRIGFYNV